MNDNTSALSSLDLPERYLKLLEKGGFTNVGDLASRIEDDPDSILAIDGIGPKTFQIIQTALETFSPESDDAYHTPVESLGDQFKAVKATEQLEDEKDEEEEELAEEYLEPVQSLGDQFKSVPPATPKVAEQKAKTEKKAKKDKKKKDKKPKKKDKKRKKADKKKDKPKKSKEQKSKKKDKKVKKKKKK